jgi:probable F420-dependent oxidoreductase
MKFTIQYPMHTGFDPRFLEPERMIRFARSAEELGFDAIALTEHPAPSTEWLTGMGHESLDPLTALSFFAGVTTRIRLITYLFILPYRNPLLAAKQATTVDVISGGRLTLAVGAGYLESEFAALGVDFSERNALFDEALDVLQMIWRSEDFHYDGRHFHAAGQIQRPMPVQQPHPPLWFGGNSRTARRRAARIGQGWTPLLIDERTAGMIRTRGLTSPAQLRVAVAELREFAAEAGRDPDTIDVQVDSRLISDMQADPEVLLDAIGEVADAGATWVVVEPPNDDADHAFDVMAQFSDQVIEQSRSA